MFDGQKNKSKFSAFNSSQAFVLADVIKTALDKL